MGQKEKDETEFLCEHWMGGYSKKELKERGCEIVEWPESQNIPEMDGASEHAWLINDPRGLKRFGSAAYVVESEWWNE